MIATTTDYGESFVSSIATDRLFACQFHPEKSQELGLRILANFGRFRQPITEIRALHASISFSIVDYADHSRHRFEDGRCVRLFQGDMDKETVYFDDPSPRPDIG